MKTSLGKFLITLFFIATILVFNSMKTAALAANTSLASNHSYCQSSTFFGLEPWYYFLNTYKTSASTTTTSQCGVCFNILGNSTALTPPTATACTNTRSDIPLVLLAIIDDLLRIAGLVAVGFIIFAAFRYVTSQGNPENSAKAQNTILYALVGLVIAISAIAVVTYIGNSLIK